MDTSYQLQAKEKPLQRGKHKNNLFSSYRIRSNEKSKTQMPRLSPLTSPKSACILRFSKNSNSPQVNDS